MVLAALQLVLMMFVSLVVLKVGEREAGNVGKMGVGVGLRYPTKDDFCCLLFI